jgi:hypothetical protein
MGSGSGNRNERAWRRLELVPPSSVEIEVNGGKGGLVPPPGIEIEVDGVRCVEIQVNGMEGSSPLLV